MVWLFKDGPVYATLAYLRILALIVKTESMGQINVFEFVLPENMKNQKKGLPILGLNHDPYVEKFHMLFFK